MEEQETYEVLVKITVQGEQADPYHVAEEVHNIVTAWGQQEDAPFEILGADGYPPLGSPNLATVKTFTYQELSEKIPESDKRFTNARSPKQRARDWLTEVTYAFTPELVTELFNTELEIRGLEGLKTSWSLGHCQGDGVAFEGTITLTEPPKNPQTDEPDESFPVLFDNKWGGASLWIRLYSHDHHYTHWNSFGCDIELMDAEGEVLDDELQLQVLETQVLEYFQDLSKAFEQMGYDEIEYQESDEQLNDMADANDYLFAENGEPIHHLIEQEVQV